MTVEDLRGFVALLERERQLLRIAEPVDPHLESTALRLRASCEGGPALLTEKAGASPQPFLGNLFGHRRRIELALAGRPLASLRELGRLLRRSANRAGRRICARRSRNGQRPRSSPASRRGA